MVSFAHWQVRRQIWPEFPDDRWWVNRYPHPEDDGIFDDDVRWMIDGSPHPTWADAMRAANEGARLDTLAVVEHVPEYDGGWVR